MEYGIYIFLIGLKLLVIEESSCSFMIHVCLIWLFNLWFTTYVFALIIIWHFSAKNCVTFAPVHWFFVWVVLLLAVVFFCQPCSLYEIIIQDRVLANAWFHLPSTSVPLFPSPSQISYEHQQNHLVKNNILVKFGWIISLHCINDMRQIEP